MIASRHAIGAVVAGAALVSLVAFANGFAGGGGGGTCTGAASVASLTSSGAITAASFAASGAFTSTVGTSQDAIILGNQAQIQESGDAASWCKLNGRWECNKGIYIANGGLDMVGVSAAIDMYQSVFMRNSATGMPVLMEDAEGVRIKTGATSMTKTCGSAADNTTVGPGTIIMVSPAAAKFQMCVCTVDSGSTYAWRNALADGAAGGSTTVCPATP